MKKRGFKFFGTTIGYAHLQASGFINDHLSGNNRDEFETVLNAIYLGGILELVDSYKSSCLRVK